MTTATEYTKRYRTKKHARGVCMYCDAPTAPDRTICPEHLERQRRNSVERRNRLRAAGLCCACGRNPAVAPAKWCDACRARGRRWGRERECGGNWRTTMERDGFTCRVCGGSAENVHHIDGNGHRSAAPNHAPDNLICLCRKCHFLVEMALRLPNPSPLIALIQRQAPTH